MYRPQITHWLLLVIVLVAFEPARAQLPIVTRQLNLQHNGNTNAISLSAPTLDSSYALLLPPAQGAAGSVLSNDGAGSLSWVSILNAATINGTTNYLTKYTSSTSLGTSVMFENGSNVGVGTISPSARLHISSSSASTKGLIVESAAGATVNVLETQSSSGAVTLSIDPNGDLTRIRGVDYSWPTAKPDAASSGSQLGSGVLEVSSTGTMSWRQMAVATATLNFPNTATRNSSDLTITVQGAASGDAVALGVPNASVLANTCYTAWVSGANTVTIRFNNYDNADKDPASGIFKVMVIK